MLRVDLHAVAVGPLETVADVAPEDPALADLEFRPAEPVRITGRIMATGPGSYFWEGRIRTAMGVTCRRCLAPVVVPIDQRVHLLFTEDEDTDDPAAVPLPPRAATLDLADAVREELILDAPEFALCRDDCRGLCPRCGTDLNQGPCQCRPGADPRWAALEALGTQGDEETR